jgi:Flp pilus assembly pilin Flp
MALDMTTALTIRAKVDGLGQVQGLGKALGNTEKQANGLAGAFGRLKGAATSMAGVLGAAGLGSILKQSVDTFAKFQAETKLLENGLKNLGAQSGELERLQKVASNLGEATLFNEEDFRKGFGLLTSFGNIGTSNYERVAKAAADVAQTSGTDVSSAFMQLAKALNDPAKGLTALSRSGIQFTEDQKTMIKSMVEAGNTAGAQNMILKELEKQYGGNSVAAAQGLAGALDTLGEKFYDLQVALGDNVSQLLQPLIAGLTSLVGFISGLPEPVQTFIVALGGLTIALTALGGILAIGAPIFSALAGLAAGFAALGPIVAGLGTVLAVVFTGPVGIAALVIAAGIAIYAFRDQIGAAFTAIGEYFKQLPAGFQSFFIDPLVEGFKLLMEMINTTFIQPVKDAFAATLEFVDVNFVQPVIAAFTGLIESIKTIFSAVVNIITSPFKAAFETVRGIVNQILNSIGSAIGSVVNAVNGVIRGVNRGLAAAKLPQIPLIPAPQIPSFAEGGVVSGPTLAMVGEGGEPEYIVPQSKATKFANNWLSGVRGAAAIPKFAEGGVVVPGSAQVSIQTGPVTQMNGTNYVTTQDLSSAVTAGVNQTLSLLRNDMNTRRTVGLA